MKRSIKRVIGLPKKRKAAVQTIPLFKVHMPKAAIQGVVRVLKSGYVSEGEVARRFEEKLQAYLGNPHVALVNSGTSALTIALRLCGVGYGDEVITTPMTCLATNEPILLAGAHPVWADIDSKSGNIDPHSIEKRITPRTKAVMVVHWAGNPVDLDAIGTLAKRHHLKVIEDAAHALGATYGGKKIGNHSDVVCFSFQAIKHLTTVDGGAVAVNSKEAYERAVLLRWFGCAREHTRAPVQWTGDVQEPGYKMHMNDFNASIGLAQLPFLDRIIRRHQSNARYLAENLKDVPELELPVVSRRAESSFWIFTVKTPDAAFRDRFSRELLSRGIANGIVHQRNDRYALFADFRRDDLPGTDDFCSRMINIPCGWWLWKEDMTYMVRGIKDAAAAAKMHGDYYTE